MLDENDPEGPRYLVRADVPHALIRRVRRRSVGTRGSAAALSPSPDAAAVARASRPVRATSRFRASSRLARGTTAFTRFTKPRRASAAIADIDAPSTTTRLPRVSSIRLITSVSVLPRLAYAIRLPGTRVFARRLAVSEMTRQASLANQLVRQHVMATASRDRPCSAGHFSCRGDGES